MKNTILLPAISFLLLVCGTIEAQEAFKHITLRDDGAYVFLYGENGSYWSGIPESLANKLRELNQQGQTFKSVALRDDGAYVFLYGENGFYSSGIPESLANKLRELNQQGQTFKSVALGDDGTYVLLYGKNGYHYSLYKENHRRLIDKLEELSNKGHTLKSIAFRNDGTYVLLYGKNGYSYRLYTDSKDKNLAERLDNNYKEITIQNPQERYGAGTIHFLLFTDTDDSRVGSAAEQTNRYFQNTFVPKLERHTGMQVRTYYKSGGGQFTRSELNNTISNLRTGSNDVIFFYYAGHGYNQGYSNYPTLTLGVSGSPIDSRKKRLIDIYNTLKNKSHRLLIVMAEACNKVYARRNSFSVGQLANNFNPYEDEGRHFRELFVDARGEYIMSSSRKDQLSHLATGQPGYFSCGFRDAFAHYVDSRYDYTATWEKVFNKTKEFTTRNAEQIGEYQVPQWCSGYCE